MFFFHNFILDGELIMKCFTCHRWYHGECDSIVSEEDAEKCAEEKYECPFCRPEDALPPHLIGLQKSYYLGVNWIPTFIFFSQIVLHIFS